MKNKLNFKKSLFRKAIGIASALLVLLFLVNTCSSSGEKDISEASSNRGLAISVRVMDSVAKEKVKEVSVYGTTSAVRKVNLKAEIIGKVDQIKAKEGQLIKKNDPILIIDKEDKEEILAQAEALVKQRRLEYKVDRNLNKSGHKSETDLAATYASLKEAESNLARAKIDLENTVIKAPFDGVLQEINVEEGQLIDGTDIDIVTIMESGNFLATASLPEKVVNYVKEGVDAKVTIVNDVITIGQVSYVSKLADASTRTFKVEVLIPNSVNNFVPEGMTTQIDIPINTVMAHNVSSSILSLGQEGDVGVKVLSDDNIVKFYPIQIIDEDSNGIWVEGLPKNARVITIGQAFLRDGDKANVAKGH